MKVPVVDTAIFLDVDGVLHSLFGEDVFAEGCCSLMERLVKSTGATVVLSSTWRLEPENMVELNKMFQERGLPPIAEKTLDLLTHREAEICEWLDRHPEVSRWIAIDDMDLVVRDNEHARRLQGHFVRTDMSVGLTPADAELALRLLGKQAAGNLDSQGPPVKASAPPHVCRAAAPRLPPRAPQRDRASTWVAAGDRRSLSNIAGQAAMPWPHA